MDFDPREFTLRLLREPTERDKQYKVGASNMSQLCTRCLAEQLAGGGESQLRESPYWLGSVIGTAIHNLLDDRGRRYPEIWMHEQRVIIGTIPGYGQIKSTTDGFHIPSGTGVDFKSTTREKLMFIKRAILEPADQLEPSKVTEARAKVTGYWNQLMLYGKGLTNAGHTVNSVALVFICRDGIGDKDVWSHTIPYDPAQADKVWDRANRLWEWLQAGNDPATLKSHPQCWVCSHRN